MFLGVCRNCQKSIVVDERPLNCRCSCEHGIKVILKFLEDEDKQWASSRVKQVTTEFALNCRGWVRGFTAEIAAVGEREMAHRVQDAAITRIVQAEALVLKGVRLLERVEQWTAPSWHEHLDEDSIESPK